MSNLPLTGIKLLDLAATRGGSACAKLLALWGAEHLYLPSGLRLEHPEGRRIWLMLAQEVDVLVSDAAVDSALLHEYNPRLIVCRASAPDSPWAAASGILAALLQRERFGMGQVISLDGAETPRFTGFEAQPPQAADPDETLIRLGYPPEAIATLRRDGIL